MVITLEMLQSEIDRYVKNARSDGRFLRYDEIEKLLNLFEHFSDTAEIEIPADVIEPVLRGMMKEYFGQSNMIYKMEN